MPDPRLADGLVDRLRDEATRARYTSDEATGRYVAAGASPVARLITAGERRAVRRAVAALGGIQGTWSDVAAGSGRMVGAGLAGRRIAVDVSAAMLACDRSGDPALVADARHLPLVDGAVSVAVVVRLLHRCSDVMVRTVVAEVLRTSRDGVVLSDVVPSPGWRRVLRRALGRGPSPPGRRRAHLRELVIAAGGQVVADCPTMPLLSAGHVVAVRRR